MCQMVVAGKTFDAHLQLMDKVKYLAQDQVLLFPSDENYQFTFVFCPISSRVASDVEAAMGDVKGKEKKFQPVHTEVESQHQMFFFYL